MRRSAGALPAAPRVLLARLLAGLLAGLLAVSTAPAVAQSSDEGRGVQGLGGNPGLPADATVPFRAGIAGELRFEATVQNLGDERAGLRVTTDGPAEVRVRFADGFVAPLDPGEQRRIPLVLEVGPNLAFGDHPVRFTLSPTSPAGPVAGFSLAPGLSGRVVVQTRGAEARVRVVARDLLDDAAAQGGEIALYALQPGDPPLLLEATGEDELARVVVPGAFRASFERPALDPEAPPVRTAVDFDLPDGADETVTLGVVGFSVFTLEVTPSSSEDGRVEHADVQVMLRNRLEPVRRPLDLELEVRQDGRLVEILGLSTLLELPTGVTTSSSRYRPVGGFTPGLWEFDVRLASGWIAVGPDEPVGFVVPGAEGDGLAGRSGLLMAVAALVVLGAAGGLAARARLRRR